MCAISPLRLRRPSRRTVGRGLLVAAAVVSASCSGSDHHPVTQSSTTSAASSVPSATTSTTVSSADLGQQAFSVYQNAFGVITQIEGSPTGRSTDPRLKQVLADPWYSQIIQEINLYRFKNQVVRGPYSFTNFKLDQVTPDGRVIFTDCQVNSQAVYNSKTGALVGTASTSRYPEQVVVYHPSPDVWQVADDNAVANGAGTICAA